LHQKWRGVPKGTDPRIGALDALGVRGENNWHVRKKLAKEERHLLN